MEPRERGHGPVGEENRMMNDLWKCKICKKVFTVHPKGVEWARENLEMKDHEKCPWCAIQEMEEEG